MGIGRTSNESRTIYGILSDARECSITLGMYHSEAMCKEYNLPRLAVSIDCATKLNHCLEEQEYLVMFCRGMIV